MVKVLDETYSIKKRTQDRRFTNISPVKRNIFGLLSHNLEYNQLNVLQIMAKYAENIPSTGVIICETSTVSSFLDYQLISTTAP